MSRERPRCHSRLPITCAFCVSDRLISIDPAPFMRCTTAPGASSDLHSSARSSEPGCEHAAAAAMASRAMVFFTASLLRSRGTYAQARRKLLASQFDTAVYRLEPEARTTRTSDVRANPLRIEPPREGH